MLCRIAVVAVSIAILATLARAQDEQLLELAKKYEVSEKVLKLAMRANSELARGTVKADPAVEIAAKYGAETVRAVCALIERRRTNFRTWTLVRAAYQPGAEAPLLALARDSRFAMAAIGCLAGADCAEVRHFLLDLLKGREADPRNATVFTAAQALVLLEDVRAAEPIAGWVTNFLNDEYALAWLITLAGEGCVDVLKVYLLDERATDEHPIEYALTKLVEFDRAAAVRVARELARTDRFKLFDRSMKKLVESLVTENEVRNPDHTAAWKERLARAELLVESERDDATAAEIYLSLLKEPGLASPEMVAKVRSQYARCLLRLGRTDEARRIDPTMDLGVQDDLEPELAGRIETLLARGLRAQGGLEPEKAASELVWIGRVAVPRVVAALEHNRHDYDYVTTVAGIILRIGGPDAVACYERIAASKETLYRRAALRCRVAPDASMDGVLLKFLDDPDERVRSRMVDFLYSHRHLVTANIERAIPALERQLERLEAADEMNTARTVVSMLSPEALKCEAGWDFFLRYIRQRKDRADLVSFNWAETFPRASSASLVELARVLGTVKGLERKGWRTTWNRSGKTMAQRHLEIAIKYCYAGWDHSSMTDVLELLRFGYRIQKLSQWIGAKAISEDLPAILRDLGSFGDPMGVLGWAAAKHPGAGCIQPLLDWIENCTQEVDLHRAFQVLAAIGTPEAMKHALDLVRERPSRYVAAGRGLTKGRGAALESALLELMVFDPPGSEEAELRARWSFFLALSRMGNLEAIERLPRAYKAGFHDGGFQEAPLKWLAVHSPDGVVEGKGARSQLDESALMRALDLLLVERFEMPWKELWLILRYREGTSMASGATSSFHLSDPALKLVRERLTRCPMNGIMLGILEVLLGDEQHLPSVKELLNDERINTRFLDHLQSPEPTLRAKALRLLGRWNLPGAVERTLPFLSDPDKNVRDAAIWTCRTLLDMRAVPGLLDALRDSDHSIRKSAQSALDAIYYYHQQSERWRKLLDENALDAANAAEALLKQAAKDQPKKVRLAAIASLGTLAVPETLPLLIRMMREEDAEIAVAAYLAVQRVNRGKETGADKEK